MEIIQSVGGGRQDAQGKSRPALFLDRDGTINGDRSDYVKSLDEFQFLPRTFEAFRRLAALDVPIIVVTNQSQIGQGITAEDTIREINRYLISEVRAKGGRITDVYVCPHAPGEGCECRKPKPGLLLRASEDYHIDLSGSYVVGDRSTDVGAARAAGCHSIFISPNLNPPSEVLDMNPEIVVRNLFEATTYIERHLGVRRAKATTSSQDT